MDAKPTGVSVVLRGMSAAAATAAIVMLLHRAPVAPAVSAAQPDTVAAPVVPDQQAAAPNGWLLRTGGWVIRVDGATLAIPSLAQQTAARPRASLATSISPFDYLIMHHAKAEGLDWRLIAALMFEESGFDPTAASDKGAYGLMQVRPIAAEAVGAGDFEAPDDNIRTGVRYLRQLDETFHEARGRDRLCLVLAAYNMGPGHVRDAQNLARRFGYDPNRWEDAMDMMLPLLERPAIYRQLPNGFAQGADTVRYVQRILDRYRRYQRETPGVSGLESESFSSSELNSANG